MKNVFITSILLLFSVSLNAMAPGLGTEFPAQEECGVCFSTLQELGVAHACVTTCCRHFICRNDADFIAERARNNNTPALCPFCRRNPLLVRPMNQRQPQNAPIEIARPYEAANRLQIEQDAALARQIAQQDEANQAPEAACAPRNCQGCQCEQARPQQVRVNRQQIRAYIIQPRDNRGRGGPLAYVEEYKDMMARNNGLARTPEEIVVCLPQETDDAMCANFFEFLTRLCHEYRPRASTGLHRHLEARRIIYDTTINEGAFQRLVDQANQHCFGF